MHASTAPGALTGTKPVKIFPNTDRGANTRTTLLRRKGGLENPPFQRVFQHMLENLAAPSGGSVSGPDGSAAPPCAAPGCSRGRHINSVGAGCPCYDQRRLLDAAVRLSRAGADAMQPVVQLISDCADPAVPESVATGSSSIPDPSRSLVTCMPDNGAVQGKRPHEGAVPEGVLIEEAVPVTRKARTMSQSGDRSKRRGQSKVCAWRLGRGSLCRPGSRFLVRRRGQGDTVRA